MQTGHLSPRAMAFHQVLASSGGRRTVPPDSKVVANPAELTKTLIEEEHTRSPYIRNLPQEETGIGGGLHRLLL